MDKFICSAQECVHFRSILNWNANYSFFFCLLQLRVLMSWLLNNFVFIRLNFIESIVCVRVYVLLFKTHFHFQRWLCAGAFVCRLSAWSFFFHKWYTAHKIIAKIKLPSNILSDLLTFCFSIHLNESYRWICKKKNKIKEPSIMVPAICPVYRMSILVLCFAFTVLIRVYVYHYVESNYFMWIAFHHFIYRNSNRNHQPVNNNYEKIDSKQPDVQISISKVYFHIKQHLIDRLKCLTQFLVHNAPWCLLGLNRNPLHLNSLIQYKIRRTMSALCSILCSFNTCTILYTPCTIVFWMRAGDPVWAVSIRKVLVYLNFIREKKVA